MVGTYRDASKIYHGFVHSGGQLFSSFNYPKAIATYALGVNDFGEIVGYFTDANNTNHGYLATPLYFGVSGSNVRDIDKYSKRKICCGVGTLGSAVEIASVTYILSNDHVLGLPKSPTVNSAHVGDAITQPGLADNKCKSATTVGNFASAPTLASGVDAALATVKSGQMVSDGDIDNVGIPASTTVSAMVGMPVAKQGRTTGLTCGHVTGTGCIVKQIGYTDRPDCNQKGVKHFFVDFSDQILIQGSGKPFSDHGDSGSLILDSSTAEATGLLFGGSKQVTFANPIDTVLAAVGGATMIGGASHTVTACSNMPESAQENQNEILLPESERLRALEARDANLDWLANDSSVISTCVGSKKDQPTEGAIILVLRSDLPHRDVPSELNGVSTRVIYSEPIIAGADYNCPVKK